MKRVLVGFLMGFAIILLGAQAQDLTVETAAELPPEHSFELPPEH